MAQTSSDLRTNRRFRLESSFQPRSTKTRKWRRAGHISLTPIDPLPRVYGPYQRWRTWSTASETSRTHRLYITQPPPAPPILVTMQISAAHLPTSPTITPLHHASRRTKSRFDSFSLVSLFCFFDASHSSSLISHPRAPCSIGPLHL